VKQGYNFTPVYTTAHTKIDQCYRSKFSFEALNKGAASPMRARFNEHYIEELKKNIDSRKIAKHQGV